MTQHTPNSFLPTARSILLPEPVHYSMRHGAPEPYNLCTAPLWRRQSTPYLLAVTCPQCLERLCA